LEKHLRRLRANQASLRPQDLLDCHTALEDLKAAESKFHDGFPDLLRAVREQSGGFRDVKQFIDEFSGGASSPQRFLSVIPRSSAKLDLMDALRSGGAICINSHDVEKYMNSARYIFYWSDTAMEHPTWERNIDLVTQILAKQSLLLVAVDCDATGVPLLKARVSQVAKGTIRPKFGRCHHEGPTSTTQVSQNTLSRAAL
jgi:hypothetical protein